jgi:hypothetical protein
MFYLSEKILKMAETFRPVRELGPIYTAAHLRDLAPQGFNVSIGESAILPSFSKIPKHGLQESILSYGADN